MKNATRHVIISLLVALVPGCGHNEIWPGDRLSKLPGELTDTGQARLAWLLSAGDCLICEGHTHDLRLLEKEDSTKSVVILIGTDADTLNVREFLTSRRIRATIHVWPPDDADRVGTPDLLVLKGSLVLWSARTGDGNNTGLEVIRTIEN